MIRGWFVSYLLVVLLWGGSYGLTEIALSAFSPGQVALCRALMGAGSLLVLVLATGQRLPRLGAIGALRILVLAALTTAACLGATTAQQRMPSGMVAVLCATTPLFAVFLHRLSGRHTPAITWMGVLLGIAGAAVLFSPSGHIDPLAVALSLGAAGLFALAGFLAGIFFAGTEFSGTQLTMTQLFFSGVLLFPVTPRDSVATAAAGVGPLLALLALGVLGAAAGNVLYWRVLRQAGPVVVSTTYQTVPLVAVLVGVVALGERFGTGEIAGAVLILSGLGALLVGNRSVLKREDTALINRKGRCADRQPVTAAASLMTSPETIPAQHKPRVEIMTTTITRVAAGLLVAAGLALGAAPVATAAAENPGGTTSQSDIQTPSGPTGLDGNLPGRFVPQTIPVDQFAHLPFNPAMPGGD